MGILVFQTPALLPTEKMNIFTITTLEAYTRYQYHVFTPDQNQWKQYTHWMRRGDETTCISVQISVISININIRINIRIKSKIKIKINIKININTNNYQYQYNINISISLCRRYLKSSSLNLGKNTQSR